MNCFSTDALDKTSPIIRALAVRTMGCIRVSEVVSYLFETLKKSLEGKFFIFLKKNIFFC